MAITIKVIKGNVELDIAPEDKARYMLDGFSVIDENGNITEMAMPNDVQTLQVLLAKANAENEALKSEIAKLKAKKTPKSAE